MILLEKQGYFSTPEAANKSMHYLVGIYHSNAIMWTVGALVPSHYHLDTRVISLKENCLVDLVDEKKENI